MKLNSLSKIILGGWLISPPGIKALCCKWIFKRKLKFEGPIDKYKARLVANKCRQKECFNFFDTYSSITKRSGLFEY